MDIPKHITRDMITLHLRDNCMNCGAPGNDHVHMGGQIIGTVHLCRACNITMACVELVDRIDNPTGTMGGRMLTKTGIKRVRKVTGMNDRPDHEIVTTARAYARQADRLDFPMTIRAAITTARAAVRTLEGQRVPADEIPAKAAAAGRAHIVRCAIERLAAQSAKPDKPKGGKKGKDKVGKKKSKKK
jgi:hypothetical protein